VFSIVLGVVTWIVFLATPAGEVFPGQLAGSLMAIVGMLVCSLGPQSLKNLQGPHCQIEGMPG